MNMPTRRKIILAGGSGFIGTAIAKKFVADGWNVVVLTRRIHSNQANGLREVQWDGRSVEAWAAELEASDAVVNLAGRSINCRHTAAHRAEIIESRVSSVLAVTQAIAQARQPPAVLIQASAIGIYGDTGETVCTEITPTGVGFIAQTCAMWEHALLRHPMPGTRHAILRLGLVLERSGGLLVPLGRLTRWGLGGAVGTGRQWMSWIHMADIVGIVEKLIRQKEAQGVYVACTPHPVRNAEFMAMLRRTLHRPWSPPVPALAVRIGAGLLGTEPDLALQGCRCLPDRLLEMGYEFEYPDLPEALAEIYGQANSPVGLAGRKNQR